MKNLLRRTPRAPAAARPLANERGVAMMMAMVTMLLMTILAAELVYETSVYNGIVFRQVDTLRAEMLARSGLRLALLETRAAGRARTAAKGMGVSDTSIVDELWQTPLILPPPPAAAGDSMIATQALKGFGDSLGLNGTISLNITGENSRLSLNTLVWNQPTTNTSTNTNTSVATQPTAAPVAGAAGAAANPQQQQQALQASRKNFVQLVDNFLIKKRETDENFAQKYGTINGTILTGNLVAWMDPSVTTDGENRDKFDYYNSHQPDPYGIKEAPLYSESELYMIKGFDDELAKIFQDNFTTQFTGGFDVNEASPTALQILIPELGPAEAQAIVKRRQDESQGGKFKTDKEFWAFLETLGNFQAAQQRITQELKITILGSQTAYRVTVTGTSGQATRTYSAMIGPYFPTSGAPVNGTGQEAATTTPVTTAAPTTVTQQGAQQKKTDAQDLHVLYLKAE